MNIKKVNEMINTSFKNILIVTTSRDNQGAHWVSDDGMCGSDRGYIFGGSSTLFTDKLPVTVEHIIDYVF